MTSQFVRSIYGSSDFHRAPKGWCFIATSDLSSNEPLSYHEKYRQSARWHKLMVTAAAYNKTMAEELKKRKQATQEEEVSEAEVSIAKKYHKDKTKIKLSSGNNEES